MDLDDVVGWAMAGLAAGSGGIRPTAKSEGMTRPGRISSRPTLRGASTGAILDAARRADPLTRTMRWKVRALADALPAGGSDQEHAAATGLPVESVRHALAAEVMQYTEALPADDARDWTPRSQEPDPESAAVMGDLLPGFMAALDELDAETQVALALRFHRGLEFGDIAAMMNTTVERAAERHDAGVLTVHQALLQSVAPEGTGKAA